MKKLSVIIPAYNAENYIAAAVESVAKQPYRDIEILVINDGSTDGTDGICRSLAAQYPNMRYFPVENGGAGKARNIGISNAVGDYILFLDSDDVYIENSITQQFVERFADYDIIYTSRSKSDVTLSQPPEILPPEQEIRHYMPMLEFWTCIYKRQYLTDNGIFFFEYQKQDIETAFRFRAFSKHPALLIAPDLMFYLQRDNPLSNTHTFNYYNLYSIKSMVYTQLLLESAVCTAFLNSEAAQYAYKFLQYYRQQPCEDKQPLIALKKSIRHIKILSPLRYEGTWREKCSCFFLPIRCKLLSLFTV